MQRRAHLSAQASRLLVDEESDKDHQHVEPGREFRLLWFCGVVLYVMAAAPDVIAYALVPQMVCTTVACFRLVVVAILAHNFLDEKVHAREVLGMAACSFGTFLCICFGPRPPEQHMSGHADKFFHAGIEIYVLVVVGVLALLLLVEHSEPLTGFKLPRKLHYILLPLAAGTAFGVEKVFNTEIGFIRPPDNLPMGLLQSPGWTGMVAAIAALGLMDFYLNLRGAASMPVQVFLPSVFALSTTLQYFQSVVIFNEFKDLDPRWAAISLAGAGLSLVGAILIQPPLMESSGDEAYARPGASVKVDAVDLPP